MAQRRHSLFCHVVCSKMVLAKLPENFVPVKEWKRSLLRFMHVWYGLPAKEIHSIEGLAGYPVGEDANEDREYLQLITAAFAGENEAVPSFDLIEWNPQTKSFWFKRAAIKGAT